MPAAGRRLRARTMRCAALGLLLVAAAASTGAGTASAAETSTSVAATSAAASGYDPFTDRRTTKRVELVSVDDRPVDREHPIRRCTQETPRNACQITRDVEITSEVRGDLGLDAGVLAASFGTSQSQTYSVSVRCDFAVAQPGQRYAAYPGVTEYRYYVYATEPSGYLGDQSYWMEDLVANTNGGRSYDPREQSHIGKTTRSELRTQRVYNGDVVCGTA